MTRRDAWLAACAVASASGYLWLAVWRGAVGFPLDDAWIHQVYARNLGLRGEFAFFAGVPSAGSTSPLWSLLLALGYFLRLDFHAWTYLLGIIFLVASASVGARLLRFLIVRLTPHLTRFGALPVLGALFVIGEWHLAWSAVSGMEIPLFIFLTLILLERFYAGARPWVVGGIAGLLALTRPEGIALAALVGGGVAARALGGRGTWVAAARALVWFGLGCGIVLAPDLWFNWTATGTLLPNTFYAKAAEYAILFARAPWLARYAELLFTPFVGAQILLVPGVIALGIVLARKREWLALIPLVWVLLLPALYAWRLPVTYQHGRYEMPVIPFIALYGLWGTAELFTRIRSWVVRQTWAIALGVTLIAFWVIGAAQYVTDVAVVECEMVGTAKWIAANAPPPAMIAAHDIGALGYFYPRPFLDLAGLVSPQVIPFIRDEDRLRDFLFARGATHVVVFPQWYPAFDADPRFTPAFQTTCAVTRAAGEQNMIVYRIVR